MKKIRVVIFIFIIAAMCSCAIPYARPYGVWQSEDGSLLLDMNPDKEEPFTGEYIVDGETIDIRVYFGTNRGFRIINTDADKKNEGLNSGNVYFDLNFEVKKDGKLYYGKKGAKNVVIIDEDVIIFDKIEDYEVSME